MRHFLIVFYLIIFISPTTLWPLSMREIGQSAAEDKPAVAAAQEIQERLGRWENKIVSLRGFLYHSADGRWVLSSQPDLKTCCVGSSRNAFEQVTLNGDFHSPSPNIAVTVEGVFRILPSYDAEDRLVSMFYLDNSFVTPESSMATAISLTFLTGLTLALALFVLSTKMMRT